MILNTPSIYAINAFDPAYSHVFEFSYTGTQVESNRAIIVDKDSQEEVYNVKQDGLKLSHTIPADTLVAGHSYLIQIQVYDANGNSSDLSSAVLFYCFTTPVFKFSNINNGDTVTSANFDLVLEYSQVETETLSEYRYYMYDMTKNAVYTSESYYTADNMIHTIYGVKTDYIYYVRAIGKTAHGMDVDTGMIQIVIKYSSVASNVGFDAKNDKETGCIILSTNIITVKFEVENEDYTIENGIVDLTNNTLTYETTIDGDFSLIVQAKSLPIGDFCWTSNKNMIATIEKILGTCYCHLIVRTGDIHYDIYEAIDETYVTGENEENLVAIQIYRKNNLYDIKIDYV